MRERLGTTVYMQGKHRRSTTSVFYNDTMHHTQYTRQNEHHQWFHWTPRIFLQTNTEVTNDPWFHLEKTGWKHTVQCKQNVGITRKTPGKFLKFAIFRDFLSMFFSMLIKCYLNIFWFYLMFYKSLRSSCFTYVFIF